MDGLCRLCQLLRKRKDTYLDWCDGRMETKDGTLIAALQLFHIICCAEEGKGDTIRTEGRLNNIRDVMRVGLLIEVGHILTGGLLVLSEIVIGSVRDTPELAPAKREGELEIGGCLRIEAELLRRVISGTKHILRDTQLQQPVKAELLPVCEPLEVRIRLTEELELHLLELSRTEGEVTRCDLVTEGLTDLTDTERKLLTGRTLHVLEVDEDTLRGLRTEIYGILRVLGYTLECLEHKVELTDTGEVMLTAGRTWNLMLLDEGFHLFLRHRIRGTTDIDTVRLCEVLDQLICTETLVALLTVHQRIGEGCEMSGCNPGLRIHQDRAVDTDVIFGLLDKLLPPGSLYVVL